MTWASMLSSVAQLCLILFDPMDCSTPGFPVHRQLPELTQTHVHQVGDAIQPSHPLSFTSPSPSIFPSIRVFSNESVLLIRWPKYWSFRTDAEAETPILWPSDTKNCLTGKDGDAGKDQRQEEKGMTEDDEMVGWYHHLNGHEFV